jgi:phage terminase large subunit GpA-like protein
MIQSPNVILKKVINNLKRPPKLKLSEWAAENRILSSEESSIPGKWNPNFVPFQSGIMDAITSPDVETVVMMCSARVGKTFIATCAIGYYCENDPAPILVVKPRGEDCNSFSKQELQWLFNNTPSLSNKLSANEGKNSTNTLHFKQLTSGGSIRLAGSNSAAGLSGYSARIIILDELDKYEPIEGFGNPSDMAIGRAATFPHNKKVIYLSSPTIEHSPEAKRKTIHSVFLNSSQAYYHIPCPSCGFFQPLEWDGLKFGHCKEKLDDVYYECCNCSHHITEQEKKIAVRSGKWVEMYPDNKVKGFAISQLYSPFTSFEDIAREWIPIEKSNDIYSIQRFKNEVLGLPFKEDLGIYKDNWAVLFNRRESYINVPSGASLITMAVDIQDSWISYSVFAWGKDREGWLIETGRIEGDPAATQPWIELNKIILKKYKHISGILLPIEKVLIDTQGHKTQHVNKFLKGRGPTIQGIYGARTPAKPIITQAKRDTATGLRKWEIGTEAAKSDIFNMLAIELPGPGYLHFPESFINSEGKEVEVTEEYFKELYSERKVGLQFKKIGSRRNEKLDELAYNLAAYYICGKNYNMEDREKMLKEAYSIPVDTENDINTDINTDDDVIEPIIEPVLTLNVETKTEIKPEIKPELAPEKVFNPVSSAREAYLAKVRGKNTNSGGYFTDYWENNTLD